MIPSQVIADRIRTLLATDTTTFALAATPGKVHLSISNFTPSPALLVGSFTEATFNTYAPLLLAINAQQQFNDPLTGGRVMQLIEPLAGWHWQAGSATGLPQTVFGYYVTDNASAVLWGSALLPSGSVTLTNTADAVDIPFIRITFPPNIYL